MNQRRLFVTVLKISSELLYLNSIGNRFLDVADALFSKSGSFAPALITTQQKQAAVEGPAAVKAG
ncbi:hypothetical protein EHF33_14345 [Deinococcus psychrotolerans]|uniref:Uncharacterized protein n=1 Tax=Deinococcus psychrotolerans TaxID=2489213 RepID=A0A3G8YFM4_9DEIO|nr:hypothetical protein [Deinococcus psychrotolerans]AZI44092.1 hypothetical protein EHF33_14345 [Deinococcus psychrotolerans]